ncbi:MAG: metallophosphoesterase [Candidatus Omnitrophica bacterium]|nr:metallophosphoesterase [Candidatus Omnitrophota bacterium]
MSDWTRRQFLQTTTAAAAGAMAGPSWGFHRQQDPIGLAPSNKHPETLSRLKIENPNRIKVLQLTDIHFFCSRDKFGDLMDRQTIKDLPKLIELTQPDLLAVTGDLWHDNPAGRGGEFMEFGVEQIENLGLPWLFTWGNHDQMDNYVEGHDRLTEAKGSLYRGGPGSGNYSVLLEDREGKPVWEFLCLNTTNIGIQKEQEEWLKGFRENQSGRESVPMIAFLHIPVLQYQYIWEEKLASGFKLENVCHYGEDGSGIWHIQDLGRVQACFCGHDHVNDYGGELEGIELAYGRATGYAGYGGEKVKKGGKLITLDPRNETYEWETVLYDGTRWHPEKGFQAEEVLDTPWMRGA